MGKVISLHTGKELNNQEIQNAVEHTVFQDLSRLESILSANGFDEAALYVLQAIGAVTDKKSEIYQAQEAECGVL